MIRPGRPNPPQPPLIDATVAELLLRLESRDPDALAELFAYYNDKFHRLVDVRLNWTLRGRLDVADVLQESYLDARDRLDHFFSREERSIFV